MPPGRAPNRKGRQAAERDPCRLPSLSCVSNQIPSCEGNNFTARQMLGIASMVGFFHQIESQGIPKCAKVMRVSK
jgi:hypothetical protein